MRRSRVGPRSASVAMTPALEVTWFIDSDHPAVQSFADETVGDARRPRRSRRSHSSMRVRDGDPVRPVRDHLRAGRVPGERVLGSDVELVRAQVGAADRRGTARRHSGAARVRRRPQPPDEREAAATDGHRPVRVARILASCCCPTRGGTRWFKLSSAFNIELCERFGVKVLEFDGTDDALMHAFDQAGNRHMEYVNQRGSFDDLPLDRDARRLPGGLRQRRSTVTTPARPTTPVTTAFSAG